MNEEQIIDKVSMIDQWKVSGDSYTQGELDAIGQLLELYYDNKKELEQEKEKNNNLIEQLQEQNTEIQDISRQLRQKKEKNKELEEHQRQYLDGELITAKQGKFFEKMIKENYISKDKIKKFIKEELPGEEICKSCDIYDVNGVSLKEKLEKILEV